MSGTGTKMKNQNTVRNLKNSLFLLDIYFTKFHKIKRTEEFLPSSPNLGLLVGGPSPIGSEAAMPF